MLKGFVLSLAVLVLLVLLLRVGIVIVYQESGLTAHLKIGCFRRQAYPRKKKKKALSQAAVDLPSGLIQKADLSATSAWRPSWVQLTEGGRVLWPVLRKALARTRKRVRVDPCHALAVFGGPDPDQVARHYGQAQALVWAVMPCLEQVLHLPGPDIRLRWDFNAEKTTVEARLGLSIRVGDILGIGFCAGLPTLRWLLAARRQSKKHAAAASAPVN